MDATKKPLAALFGLGFFVLGIAGTLAYPSAPDFADEPAKIAAFYTENSNSVLITDTLYLLAGALLLAFVGYLFSVSRRVEADEGGVAATAFAGGVAGVAMLLGAASLDAVAALRVDEQSAIDPEVAAALWDTGSILFGLAAPTAFAVLVLGTAVLALRRGLLPKWHGAISVVLGVALAIPPISYFAIIVFNFWVLLTSLLLYLRGEPARVGADRQGRREAIAPR